VWGVRAFLSAQAVYLAWVWVLSALPMTAMARSSATNGQRHALLVSLLVHRGEGRRRLPYESRQSFANLRVRIAREAAPCDPGWPVLRFAVRVQLWLCGQIEPLW